MCNECNLSHRIYSRSVKSKVFPEKVASKVEFPSLQTMQLSGLKPYQRTDLNSIKQGESKAESRYADNNSS